MKTIIIFSAIALLFLNAQSCNTTEPPQDNIQPGRRDYTWKADTLWADDWFGVHHVWGSSPSSIWVVAVGTTAKDCLWHYDGVKWSRENQLLSSNLSAVFGFSEKEVWVGDAESSIWKYDGNSWKLFEKLSLPNYDFIAITSIYGTSSNNLYTVGFADHYDASGYKGIIFRYDGKTWNSLNIPEIKVGFNDLKRMKNGNYLITGTNVDNGFLEKLFVFDGDSKLKEIYSDYQAPLLYQIGSDLYITINRIIYIYINEKLTVWKDFSNTSYYGTVLGRSEKDIFSAGYNGILHYNGTDLVNLYNTKELGLTGVLIFENDVFFGGYNSDKQINVMIRGTLK